jgi:hypothetical protein
MWLKMMLPDAADTISATNTKRVTDPDCHTVFPKAKIALRVLTIRESNSAGLHMAL